MTVKDFLKASGTLHYVVKYFTETGGYVEKRMYEGSFLCLYGDWEIVTFSPNYDYESNTNALGVLIMKGER